MLSSFAGTRETKMKTRYLIIFIAFGFITCTALNEKPDNHHIAKRDVDTNKNLETETKPSEKEEKRKTPHIRYMNVTYREEFCKAKNWSIHFGW